jgi:transcriptional regulator with XRE-family HTH domain
VDGIRFGRHLRALRVRKKLRQDDVARHAGISRAVVSRIERGLIGNVQIAQLERTAAALGATLDIRVRWNGEQLDRLLDEGHARLVEIVVALLRMSGWEVGVEVSYSIWGERGSIDVFAFHPLTRIVLVVEVKSVVPDSQAMLHAMDRKTRLAGEIASARGWEAIGVARLLVVGASATSRRRVARLASTYDSAFPDRGRDARRWLDAPHLPFSGLMFVAHAPRGSDRNGGSTRERVRRSRSSGIRNGSAPTAPRESA